jgi:hypothetical protein
MKVFEDKLFVQQQKRAIQAGKKLFFLRMVMLITKNVKRTGRREVRKFISDSW